MVRPVTWTDDRKRRFAEVYADQAVPVPDIARRFGVTIAAAHQQASELGVHRAQPRPGNGRKRRHNPASAHPNTWDGPWLRRCACGATFTAHRLEETTCETCR